MAWHRGIDITSAKDVEWVQITLNRRIAYGAGAILVLLFLAIIAWFDYQDGKTAFLNAVIMGAIFGCGVFLAHRSITGKEPRKKDIEHGGRR